MQQNPFVSIIIIAEKWNSFLEEALPKYRDLNYSNFEILLFLTEDQKRLGAKFGSEPNLHCYINPELKNNPPQKRDLAIKYAKGDIYAFIDDDAFPSPNWLTYSVKNFSDPLVVAVGGPGLTPENASILEKSSGWVSASPLGGFGSTYRFSPSKKRFVDDYPSFNLLVRKESFVKVGGFDSNYYPGEDTKLCLELTKDGIHKIIYDPKAVVYHHKRPLFKKHLIQNGRYGLHRGHFARILPATSRRWYYFIPSLFFLYFCLLLIVGLNFKFEILNFKSISNSLIFKFLIQTPLILYIVLLIVNAGWVFSKCRNIQISLLTIPGVFLTHFWYGVQFLRGYFMRNMEDNYGRV